MEEGKLIRTKDGFSKEVLELDLGGNKLEVVSTMNHGRDLRNKIAMLEDKVYIMGGSQLACEAYNYIDKKWVPLKSYERLMMKDSLDSWACTSFVNFPKISHINRVQNDYLSDYYSDHDYTLGNFYTDSLDDDNDIYDEMDMDSELSISRNSFFT